MFRVVLLLVLSGLPSVATADPIVVLGGDNIGSTNATVNGNGAVAGHGGTWGDNGVNFGLPAIPFTSDGTLKLHDFRIIAAMSQSPVPGLTNVDWSQQNWTIGVFQRNAYLNQGVPVLEHSFGATPDNWSGFNRVSPILNIPATTPFGNFGTTAQMSQDLYDLQFSFAGLTAFESPLAAGDYFIGLQSKSNQESFGLAGLAITNSGVHADYYWHDGTFAPTQVFPGLSNNPNAGIAFSVRVTSVPEPGGLALLGVLAPLALGRYRKRQA